ncbi:MAG: DUF859 family phage minor structural protein [Christensenellales bacterium]
MATFTSASYEGRYLQLTITETVNVAANTSTLSWTLTSAGGSAVYYTVDTTTVTINGTTVYEKARTNWEDRVFPAAKGSVSGTITVAHNSDGTKTVDIGFSTRVYIFGPQEYGGTMTLTNIDRTAPTVSCSISGITAYGFKISASSSATADIWQYSTNGGTSWTQFSTTAGTSASITLSSLSPNTSYSVRVKARKKTNQVYGTSGTSTVKTLGGGVINSCPTITADAATVSFKPNVTVYDASYSYYLSICNGATEYLALGARTWTAGTADRTITLTQTERADLLDAMASIKSFSATLKLVTMSGTTQIGSTTSCICTIQTTEANSAPTMTAFTYKDSRSNTTAVTGNDQLFIQGYSYLYITPGTATAKNGASIVKYAATCNGVSGSNTTGSAINLSTVSKAGTLDVVVTATDSRGYTVSSKQQITVIAYAKPKVSSITLRRTNDIEAEMQLVFNGSISPITVDGTQKNSLKYVQYRYKLTSESSYGSYTSILSSVTQNGTSFSYSNLELCSLDANSSYDFHVYIRDQLNTLSSVSLYFTVPQGTPLVALRKQKVGINTPNPEAALHVVGDAKIEGAINAQTVTATSLSGILPISNVTGTLPISKGGTGATTAAGAVTNIVNGQAINPLYIDVGANRYWNSSQFGIHLRNSDMVGLNGLFFGDAVDSSGEGINFYRSSTTWDRLYAYNGALYFAPNQDINTHPGTRYTVYHSGGATIPISKGGTGATSAAAARTNLGISCTSLYSGTLSGTTSITFNYGSYKAYIIVGAPSSSSSRVATIIPKNVITTSAVSYQFADETNYKAFKLSYSGTTVTLTGSGGNGVIYAVYGMN